MSCHYVDNCCYTKMACGVRILLVKLVPSDMSLYFTTMSTLICAIRLPLRVGRLYTHGSIHGWATTLGTKDLRTLSHWILTFIMIYYY